MIKNHPPVQTPKQSPKIPKTNVAINRHSSVYSLDELTKYFNALMRINFGMAKHKLYFKMQSATSIELSYDPTNRIWTVDGEAIPVPDNGKPGAALAEKVRTKFQFQDKIILGTTVFCDENEVHKMKIVMGAWQDQEDWKAMHLITKAKANFKDPLSKKYWIDTVIKQGQSDIAEDVVKKMTLLNKSSSTFWQGVVITLLVIGAGVGLSFLNLPAGVILAILGMIVGPTGTALLIRNQNATLINQSVRQHKINLGIQPEAEVNTDSLVNLMRRETKVMLDKVIKVLRKKKGPVEEKDVLDAIESEGLNDVNSVNKVLRVLKKQKNADTFSAQEVSENEQTPEVIRKIVTPSPVSSPDESIHQSKTMRRR